MRGACVGGVGLTARLRIAGGGRVVEDLMDTEPRSFELSSEAAS